MNHSTEIPFSNTNNNYRSVISQHHQDEMGNKLTEDEILNGNIEEAYITKQKEIPGYSFKEVQGITSGIFDEEAQEITYIYI